MVQRRRMFGLDFVDAPTVQVVLAELLAQRAEARVAVGADADSRAASPVARGSGIVVTPNVDHLVKLKRNTDATAAAVAASAEYVLPDGQPIVWASRLLGAPLTARLPGSSLVAELWPQLVVAETPALVVASSDEIATRAGAEHRNAVCLVAPKLPLDDVELFEQFTQQCVAAALEAGVEFAFFTVGFPRQERLIESFHRQWRAMSAAPIPVCLGIGASFEMYYGLKRRAPRWMQRIGAEWFFRFIQEPRRLFHRYFIDGLAFPGMVIAEWRARR